MAGRHFGFLRLAAVLSTKWSERRMYLCGEDFRLLPSGEMLPFSTSFQLMGLSKLCSPHLRGAR